MKPKVIVGYDQTPLSSLALDEAAAEAVRRGAVLSVVHAFHPAPSASRPHPESGISGAAHAAALRIAESGAERARSHNPGLEVRARAVAGSAPDVLTECAHDADLLVVGYHDRLAGLVLDTVVARLAARPACPTMIVHGGRHEPRGTVLAAVDIQDPAEEVLAFAFDEARLRRTGLKAISAQETFWPRTYAGDVGGLRAASIQAEDNADLALEHLLKRWQAEYHDVHTRHELADGPPAVILTAATSHTDLIVMGAHRHGDDSPVSDAHVGPTVHPVLLRADCPVVIVPRGPVHTESSAPALLRSRQ